MKIGSKSHLQSGEPQNASREALGAFLEASGAEKKKLETALCRFGSKKGAKTRAKMAPQNAPRCLHEAKMLQEGSKRPLGTDFNPLWEPSGAQKQHFAHSISMLQRSPGGLPGALCKTSKSIPRYSKTRLFCQERAKIFQDKPLKASLLERKPRSLQERIPQIARASLRGVGGGASP